MLSALRCDVDRTQLQCESADDFFFNLVAVGPSYYFWHFRTMHNVDFADRARLEPALMVFNAERHRENALFRQGRKFDDVLSAQVSQDDGVGKRLGLAAMRALAQFFQRNFFESPQVARSVAEVALKRVRRYRELQLYDAFRGPEHQAETVQADTRKPKQIRGPGHKVLPHNIRRVRIGVAYRHLERCQILLCDGTGRQRRIGAHERERAAMLPDHNLCTEMRGLSENPIACRNTAE